MRSLYKSFFTKKYEQCEKDKWGDDNLFIEPNIKTQVSKTEYIATDYIKKWMGNKESKILLLLGKVGTGKTALIRHFINEYLNNYNTECIEENPFPIFIPLNAVRKINSFEEIIMPHLNQLADAFTYPQETINISFKRVKHLINIGKIIIFLDAFDEMVYRMSYDMKSHNFQEILTACKEKAKIIITCRTHYFIDESNKTTKLYDEFLKDEKRIEVIHLQEFNDDQIISYIERSKSSLDEIKNNYREKDINRNKNGYQIPLVARRPLFLEMIVKPHNSNVNDKSPVDIYEEYVNRWLECEEEINNKSMLMPNTKLTILMEIALTLWNEKKDVINRSEIVDLIDQTIGYKNIEVDIPIIQIWIKNKMAAPFLKKIIKRRYLSNTTLISNFLLPRNYINWSVEGKITRSQVKVRV